MVTRQLRTVPDNQYDTAPSSAMKSHPGFHPRNLFHALASRYLFGPLSFLTLGDDIITHSAMQTPGSGKVRFGPAGRGHGEGTL
jgi:hypothetical protein